MLAAEEDFELNGHKFRAGAFIIPNADRAQLEPMLKELGLSAWAVASRAGGEDARADSPAHRLRPLLDAHAGRRLGARRARHYGVPYTYFADQKLREGNLRAKYDVIIFPHVGGTPQSHDQRHCRRPAPRRCPYKKTDQTPEPRRVDRDRRHPRRHGLRRSAGARRSSCSRAAR